MMNKLLKQSQEAFLLSLEVFNKFNIDYRLEGFCFFIINAWELMLKAKIIKDTQDITHIYYEKNSKNNSLSIGDCLKRVFSSDKNKIRDNIFQIKELRDLATHLVVPEMETLYIGLFQASVINYNNCLHSWFDIDLDKRFSPGMLAITTGNTQLDILKLKRKYPKEIITILEKTQLEISEKLKSDSENIFSIPFDYKLVFAKKQKDADILVAYDHNATNTILAVEKPISTNESYPYRALDLSVYLNEELGTSFTLYDILAAIEFENFKSNPFNKYHTYIEASKTHLYSFEALLFLITKYDNDNKYFENCRKKKKKALKKALNSNVKKLKNTDQSGIYEK